MQTAWYVHGPYMFGTAPGDFDYLKLRERLERTLATEFVDCRYFHVGAGHGSRADNPFFAWLQRARPQGPHFRLHLVEGAPDKGETAEPARIDEACLSLGFHLMRAAVEGRTRRIVLSAGHRGLDEVVAHLRDRYGLEIWLAGFEAHLSPRLQSLAHGVIRIDDFLDTLQ